MAPLHSVSRPGLSGSGPPGLRETQPKPNSQTPYSRRQFCVPSSSQVNWTLKPPPVISRDPTGPPYHRYDCCLLCTVRILLGTECSPHGNPARFRKLMKSSHTACSRQPPPTLNFTLHFTGVLEQKSGAMGT